MIILIFIFYNATINNNTKYVLNLIQSNINIFFEFNTEQY